MLPFYLFIYCPFDLICALPTEWTGYNFLRCWLLFGTYWVAYHGHDSGDIWVCHTIQVCEIFFSLWNHVLVLYVLSCWHFFSWQWILVYSGSVSSEDAYYWLGVSTAFRDISMHLSLTNKYRHTALDSKLQAVWKLVAVFMFIHPDVHLGGGVVRGGDWKTCYGVFVCNCEFFPEGKRFQSFDEKWTHVLLEHVTS